MLFTVRLLRNDPRQGKHAHKIRGPEYVRTGCPHVRDSIVPVIVDAALSDGREVRSGRPPHTAYRLQNATSTATKLLKAHIRQANMIKVGRGRRLCTQSWRRTIHHQQRFLQLGGAWSRHTTPKSPFHELPAQDMLAYNTR